LLHHCKITIFDVPYLNLLYVSVSDTHTLGSIHIYKTTRNIKQRYWSIAFWKTKEGNCSSN